MQEYSSLRKYLEWKKSTKKCVHLNCPIEFNKTCLTNVIFRKYWLINLLIQSYDSCSILIVTN